MRITIDELEAMTRVLFDHLRRTERGTIDVSQDYYWHIPKEQRYDAHSNPTAFTLGQLSDDWSELRKIASGQNDPIAYGLVWLSAVLLYVGDQEVY